MFIGGINFKEFLSDYKEWHAFVEGFSEGFCPRKAKYEPWDEGNEDEDLLKSLRKEHHYYNAGRVLGVMAFIVLITGMIVWILSLISN